MQLIIIKLEARTLKKWRTTTKDTAGEKKESKSGFGDFGDKLEAVCHQRIWLILLPGKCLKMVLMSDTWILYFQN